MLDREEKDTGRGGRTAQRMEGERRDVLVGAGGRVG